MLESGDNEMQMFEPEQIAVMKAALEQAATDVQPDTATKALMAERILRSAANGARSRDEFRRVAIRAAQQKTP